MKLKCHLRHSLLNKIPNQTNLNINKNNYLTTSTISIMCKKALLSLNLKKLNKSINLFKKDILKVYLTDKINMPQRLKSNKFENKFFKNHLNQKVVVIFKSYWQIFKKEEKNLKKAHWKEKNLLTRHFHGKEAILHQMMHLNLKKIKLMNREI